MNYLHVPLSSSCMVTVAVCMVLQAVISQILVLYSISKTISYDVVGVTSFVWRVSSLWFLMCVCQHSTHITSWKRHNNLRLPSYPQLVSLNLIQPFNCGLQLPLSDQVNYSKLYYTPCMTLGYILALKLPTSSSVSDFFTKMAAITQEHYSDHNWIPINSYKGSKV